MHRGGGPTVVAAPHAPEPPLVRVPLRQCYYTVLPPRPRHNNTTQQARHKTDCTLKDNSRGLRGCATLCALRAAAGVAAR
eukprot:scaffold6174_cov125-Isochrysis_galbana.AAC.9